MVQLKEYMQLVELFNNELKKSKEKKVAVALSAGIDSRAVAVGLHLMNKEVHAYSFTRKHKESKDTLVAKKLADHFKWKHTIITLNEDTQHIIDYINDARENYNLSRKTEIECCYPLFELLNHIEEKELFTGHGADGYHAINKNMTFYFKDNPNDIKTLDQYRSDYFSKKLVNQHKAIIRRGNEKGINVILPFDNDTMLSWFKGKLWNEVNTPQKKYIRELYPELKDITIYPHTNLQLGDSGITDIFTTIAVKELGYTSSMIMYNKKDRVELPKEIQSEWM